MHKNHNQVSLGVLTYILKLSVPTVNASGSIVSMGLSESNLKENIK